MALFSSSSSSSWSGWWRHRSPRRPNRLWMVGYYWVVGASILATEMSTADNHQQPTTDPIQNLIDDNKMLTLTEQLKIIEGISDCSHETLCTTATMDHRFFPNVAVGSSPNFAQLAKEKVDLIASFAHRWKSKDPPKRSNDELTLIASILQAIQSVPEVNQARFLVYFSGRNNVKSHWLYSAKEKNKDFFNHEHHHQHHHSGSGGMESNKIVSVEPVQMMNVTEREVENFPWFIKTPISDYPKFQERLDHNFKRTTTAHTPTSNDGSSSSSSSRKGGSGGGGLVAPEFGHWTWPYFLCGSNNHASTSTTAMDNDNSFSSNNKRGNVNTHYNKLKRGGGEQQGRRINNNSNNNNNNNNYGNNQSHDGYKVDAEEDTRLCKEAVEGSFLISYTTGFLMYNQSSNKIYGILSFDVDLSDYDINQCDYVSEEELEKESTDNPLHIFRGTHKCDRNSTTCHFIEGRRWRQSSYECHCIEDYYALRPNWNNSVPGLIAEVCWLSEIEQPFENQSSMRSYYDTVSCKPCPEGCPNCNTGESCLAEISWVFRIGLLSLSMVSSACTAGIILIVYKYRRVPVLKSSSPIFHCIVLVGCIIMYTEMMALFPILTTSSCIAVKWTRHLGFCITYTALYMKLCRVYLTFRVKSAHKIKLTEKHLLHWMSPIMVIMLLYLFAWTLSDPPMTEKMETSDGKQMIQCIYNWWDHALATGEVIFLSYGVFLCYRIRENPDAQFISYSIYNIAGINILMVALHLAILPNAGPDTKYLFAFIRTQMSTTLTIAFVFGSKLYCVLWGKPRELKEMPNSANGFGHDTLDLAEENQQLKEELQKLAGQMERLKGFAMGKNNPHLKQSSANITSADLEFNSNRLETFTAL